MNNDYQLDKVIILSRHGIRTPLLNTLELLNQVSPLTWPKWRYPDGYLTTRGGTLESYFGHYLYLKLKQQNFHLSDFNNELFIYANSVQRTVATAQFFIAGAFAGHDVKIHHQYPIEKMDPIFAPILRNHTIELKKSLLASLDQIHANEQLVPAYDLLSDILDYRHSWLYQKFQCELKHIPTTLDVEQNQEPSINGPLSIGTAVADAFLLQYYSGFSQDNVAWGKIDNEQQWQTVVTIRNHYINLIYSSKHLAKQMALPLINLIDDLIEHQSYKFSFLVGHDSNIAALLSALSFENQILEGQFEQTPIGGKLVLQRFYHQQLQHYFFKADYLYQSFEQLRRGAPLDLENPPLCVTLKLENAISNQDGFYSWSDFVQRLKANLG